MFVNTLALRNHVDNKLSFKKFSLYIKENLLNSYNYQSYPFDELVKNLKLEKDSSRNPIFDIMFVYQDNSNINMDFRNVKAEFYFPKTNISKFDLSLEIRKTNNSINIEFEYDLKLFSENYIKQLSRHYLNIINNVLDNPNIQINNLSMISNDERMNILNMFKITKDYPINKSISKIIEEQSKKSPNNIAVKFENKEITYYDLNKRANMLANHLINNNTNYTDVIAILLNRSIETIISVLSIIKSEASYIIVDDTLPQERINYILEDSNAKYCIVNNKTENLINSKFKSINLDKINLNHYSEDNLNLQHSNNLSILYTSGSTGNPKGVILHHRGFINLIYAFNDEMELYNCKNILCIASVAFDMFAVELFTALFFGKTLVLANEEEQKNPKNLSDLIIANNIDFIVTTPSRIELLLLDDFKASLKNIKSILLGGEVFKKSLYLKLKNSTKAKLFNGYGPTEISACCNLKYVDSENITIGKALTNTQTYICDSNMNLLPPNIPGEICVSGIGVANGYLNNKEATIKNFCKNPFGAGYIYKTGDLGKLNDNDELEYIGRTDNQVKLRGQRIELGEIEKIIEAYSNIKNVVVLKQNYQNREILVSYFTSISTINIDDLRIYLEKQLPKYMIPSYFIEIKKFDYTISGKIDRKTLTLPKNILEKTNEKTIEPENETQKKLLTIWKELLKINYIDTTDDFFNIGGDSLSAINLSIRIQKEFNFNITIKEILENPTIISLSKIIEKHSDLPIIEKSQIKDYYPTSSAQKRIFYSSIISGDNSIVYNSPCGILFDENLNIEKIEKCIKLLIQRHEAFRTYFEFIGNELVQKIVDNINFKIDIIENSNFSELDNIFRDFTKPFDLSTAPLFRVTIVKFSNKKIALLFDIHHIISDGRSIEIFVDELCRLYNDESLDKINITYKDYSIYENNNLNSGNFAEAEKYWLNQFKNRIPILDIPTTFPRPGVKTYKGNQITSYIDELTTEKINTISKNLGITPYMFLISIYYILLSKYSLNDDIVVGSPITGRYTPEIYNIIGMFVNTLALRHTINNSLTFKEFSLEIKKYLLNCYKYQTYPFDELVNKLSVKRDVSYTPIFNVMFIYQNNGYQKLDFNNTNSEYCFSPVEISKFDLSLEIIPIDENLKVNLDYSTDLFDEKYANNFLNHYLNILNTIINNYNIKISDINILSESEKNKILYEFNDNTLNYPKNKTISMLFEEQVEKTPNNIALVFEDQELTYKEVNEKANSLAYYLRNQLNINRNDIVGIMVNRSFEMIISILAVLKAGGAYIPIDLSYPKERINYMLTNSNSKILLTQKNLNNIDLNNILNIYLDNTDIYNLPNTNLENINTPDDLSYIIFTSGSTGLPKGVMLTHKGLSNVTNYCNNNIEYLKENLKISIASITTISFDIFIFETLISLQKGLKIIIANQNEQTTPHLLNNLLEKYNVQAIQSTPSRMQLFLNDINNIPSIKNLKYIILAGEPLPSNLVQTLHSFGDLSIYNGYGPSETTVFSNITKIENNIITIGKPLNNTQIYILDKYKNPVPIGITGEIYISGDGVGKGYINNKELTDKSFIPNPFIPNTLMYKTGDLGKYDENGNITCLGRVDNQIKIRGLRIELGEIENLILKFPDINNVVVVKKELQNREFISAYYTSTRKISIPSLRKHLDKFLPKYMIPSYFVALDEFPYTANGKIDRKKLPLPTGILNISKEEYISPKSNLQKRLVTIWEKVLNTSPISVNDNFFELGGDSLLAMNLNMELQKITDKVTYTDIFRFPTILELEKKISFDIDKPMFNKIENLSDSFVDILNNCTEKDKIKHWHPKNIFLTGATGFLGMHILEQFLKHEKGNIYCLVRREPGITARTKLYQKLQYYFGDKYNKLIDKRIFVVKGNILEPGFGLDQDKLIDLANSIDVVINSAANVAHYGNYNKFYNTNVKSVKYLADFCKSFNKKLYHISTMSVASMNLDKSYLVPKNTNHKVDFTESSLYVGQIIDNVYARSKFEAEYYVLDAISKGLDGYILRMGLLTPRFKDGVFQENILDNDLINKSLSFAKIGAIPNYLAKFELEFTPVDCAARALYSIITHPSDKNRIFHLYNHNSISTEKYINLLKKLKYNINLLPENEFIDKINKILNNDEEKNMLNILMNDFDKNLHLDYFSEIIPSSKFTIKYLRKIHFKWPKISTKYLIRFINLLKKVK